MYNPIRINNFEQTNDVIDLYESAATYITEAVFDNGKKSLDPIIEQIEKIKNELDEKIKKQDETAKEHHRDKLIEVKSFDPKEYWKSVNFKDLEDALTKVFGFRNIEIHPFIEYYSSRTKRFQSNVMNCFVYTLNRYPIDGLVTEKGFYDKTHSLNMTIHITLGLVQKLSAEEILAVLLHEIGHSIDPAAIDIKYISTNVISKYITNRSKSVVDGEKKQLSFMKTIHKIKSFFLLALSSYFAFITPAKLGLKIQSSILKDYIKHIDTDEFNYITYSEAFADNFARMYGYGPALMRALKKLDDNLYDAIGSRLKLETTRQQYIVSMVMDQIDDVHKTNIHRVRALIKEYETDINDKQVPATVRKQLQEDLDELKKVMDEYVNNEDELRARISQLLNEGIDEIESSNKDNKTPDNKSK